MDQSQRNLTQASGSFYLTLASIIQSLALAFLLEQVFAVATSGGTSIGFWIRSAISFTIIILVWHEYAMGAVAYFWIVDLLDSCIPFLFAVTQFMLIYFTEPGTRLIAFKQPDAWLLSLLCFSFVTAIAYANQITKVRRSLEGIKFLPISQSGLKLALLTVFTLSILLLCSLLNVAGVNTLPDGVIPGGILALVLFHGFRIHRGWKNRMSNSD